MRSTRASRTVECVLTAEWVAPSIARDRIRRWLSAHRWSPAELQDLVLAVSEAVSNSVEHGYRISPEEAAERPLVPRGTIELHGELVSDSDGTRTVEFTIRDHGRWAIPAEARGSRGHGMTIMRACAAEVSIDQTPAGTTVVLRSWPLPARAPHVG
jgi:anti-sigma regulatory factor (Ser/Thr protein kinase)